MSVQITFRPLSGGWIPDGRKFFESCRFRSSYSQTMKLLRAELDRIDVKAAVIELDLTEGQIRRDGLPRADSRPASEKVRLSFDLPGVGPLQYPCNTFSDWRDNVRAIALTLELQRGMDRYGATRRRQQYAGWQALPPGGATVRQAMTVADAARFLERHGGLAADRVLREVAGAANLHPDRGGTSEDFKLLQEAKRVLDRHFDGGAS